MQIGLAYWNSAGDNLWASGQFITDGFAYDAETGVVAPNGERYMSWDETGHLTTLGHEYCANEIYRVTMGVEIGDLNGDKSIDALDIDQLARRIRQGSSNPRWDMNDDGLVNFDDHRVWVTEFAETFYGDADLDRVFNSQDLTHVFAAGQYEDSIATNSTWSTGDWNGDGEFDSGDFVLAFQEGGYEQGPRPIEAVPEPVAWLLCVMGLLPWLFGRWTRRAV